MPNEDEGWEKFAKDYLEMMARIEETKEQKKLRNDNNLDEWGMPLLGNDGKPLA